MKELEMNRNKPLHIEIVQKQQSRVSKDHIISITREFLQEYIAFIPGSTISENEIQQHSNLAADLEAISFCDVDHSKEDSLPNNTELVFHVYKMNASGAERDMMTDSTTGEAFVAAEVWPLPSKEFHGLWESLVYDSRLKEDTVRFVETAFEFAEHGVDPNIVGWNRVVLLHGPPGTGKTSLCRALAQKLAIRFGERYTRACLIEINAHSLFSKWFAESGKLIARLFERVHELLEDRRLLACVLIDEVESLAHARRSALAGVEPSDSIRAVNALLTQLDRLRRHSNALVLTTSNVTGAIDVAFADRADIKRRVGPPSERAALHILRGCCSELMQRGLVKWEVVAFTDFIEEEKSGPTGQLRDVAKVAAGAQVSGRALRRLPFLAVARRTAGGTPTLAEFVCDLAEALHEYLRDEDHFHNEPSHV